MRDDPKIGLPFLQCIGMVITYRCQVACPHCIFEAGPCRTEEISLDNALRWIEQIAAYRSGYIRGLSISGGEPFIDMAKLQALCARAAALGLFVSVATNAFWATTEEQALDVLHSLVGVRSLAVSCDRYHQAVIPFVRVQNAIRAAQKRGIHCTAALCTERLDDTTFQSFIHILSKLLEPDSIDVSLTFPVGRGAKVSRRGGCKRSPTPPVSACPIAASPIIFPDSRVFACVGPICTLRTKHPLLLGDLQDEALADILDRAERNTVLHTIRIWGPRKIIERLRLTPLSDALPKTYVDGSACHACFELMDNPRVIEVLKCWDDDPTYAKKIGYARTYYLGEVEPGETMVTG